MRAAGRPLRSLAASRSAQQSGGPRVLFGLPFRVEVQPAGLTVRSRSGSTLKLRCRVDFEAAPGGWRLLVGFWAHAPFSDLDVLYVRSLLPPTLTLLPRFQLNSTLYEQ